MFEDARSAMHASSLEPSRRATPSRERRQAGGAGLLLSLCFVERPHGRERYRGGPAQRDRHRSDHPRIARHHHSTCLFRRGSLRLLFGLRTKPLSRVAFHGRRYVDLSLLAIGTTSGQQRLSDVDVDDLRVSNPDGSMTDDASKGNRNEGREA